MIGQFGANEIKEPDIVLFDDNAEKSINVGFRDKTAKVFHID